MPHASIPWATQWRSHRLIQSGYCNACQRFVWVQLVLMTDMNKDPADCSYWITFGDTGTRTELTTDQITMRMFDVFKLVHTSL